MTTRADRIMEILITVVAMLSICLRRWPNIKSSLLPANMIGWPNVGLLLGQRRRRWANSKPMLGQPIMSAGLGL